MSSGGVPTVAVVGAGQLGSRHLQGLARSKCRFDVIVVDPSAEALAVARRRHDEIGGPAPRAVRYATTLADLPAELDLAIVATTAAHRRQVVEDLLATHRVRFAVLEKVLVQRPRDLDGLAATLARGRTRAWVNCPRRLNDFYAGLREPFGGPGLVMTVQGGFWGLACNGIHFIDLYAFLTRARIDRVDTGGLDARWYPSKRAGFQELAGTLVVHFDNGGRAVLHSDAESGAPVLVTLQGRAGQAAIWEQAGRAQVAVARDSWRPADVDVRLALQSELTHLVTERLLQDADCGLTPYPESAALHEPLLAALLAWSRDALCQRLDAVCIT